jgi:hypothetical protein
MNIRIPAIMIPAFLWAIASIPPAPGSGIPIGIEGDPGLETSFHQANAEGISVNRVRSPQLRPFYPRLLDEAPRMASPFKAADGTEIVVAVTKGGKYALFPVTVENGEPWKREGKDGKGRQLDVDDADFPTLALTGRHSELELDAARRIAGRSVAEITDAGRPGGSSGIGFMGPEEDILSVLRGDNRLVKAMGLTHPELARPLFHVFNIIRALDAADRPARSPSGDIDHILYNGRRIRLGSRNENDCQPSIFDDEILGYYEIEVGRDLDAREKAFLSEKYASRGESRVQELLKRLGALHFGEMAAFYAMRYGFYEGHTGYRADPVVAAFLFGLRTLEELEKAFPGSLDRALTEPFTRPPADVRGGGR